MVFNPAGRTLTINGSKRRARRSTRRRNPVAKAIASNPRRRPVRRRHNPATTSSLLVASVMAAIGVSIFDAAAVRIMPAQSALIRAGVKLTGAYVIQQWGSKIPLLGKYKSDIALVLGVFGMLDVLQLYVFPLVSGAFSNAAAGLVAVPSGTSDQTTAGIYGGPWSSENQYIA